MGIEIFKELCYLNFTWGLKKSNNTIRNQNFRDFKSDPTLGGRKPKKLTTVSTLLNKDASFV